MLLEVLGRSREVAIERALGAPRRSIVIEFATRSMLMSTLSAAAGVALSFLLSGPLTDLILPIFSGVDVRGFGSVLDIRALALGSVSAIIIGGVFGTFPVYSVLKSGIADTIKHG